jgi:hypothetical protein
MTPLGVVYRSLCASQAEALKYSEWAAKLFGGDANAFTIVGPGVKGFYEAAIRATVPANATCVKRPKRDWPSDWYSTPEHAYVLFNDLETPIALYFDARELVLKPKEDPPLSAWFSMPMKQT